MKEEREPADCVILKTQKSGEKSGGARECEKERSEKYPGSCVKSEKFP